MFFCRWNRMQLLCTAVCIIAFCVLAGSCSRRESAEKSEIMVAKRSAGNSAVMTMNADSAVLSEPASEIPDVTETGSVQTQSPRKLIKNGSLSFEVTNLAESEKMITEWAAGFGGYIASSWSNRTSISISVKIPADNFDNAMGSTGSFGRLLSRSVSADDVSEQFYDLQARLETRRILEDKLRGYLKNATATADLLEIEEQLNKVQTEIESMEGRFRRLSNQIEFATITVSGQLPDNTTDDGPDRPEFFRSLSRFGSNLLFFLSDFILVLLYIIVFGVPILLAIACLYWLCFGKIGLVRKLFFFLSGKKK